VCIDEVHKLIEEMGQYPRLADNHWTTSGKLEMVWHYTPFETLTKIIPAVGAGDSFLRAAPLTGMNDSEDGRWVGTNVARKLSDTEEKFLCAAVQNEPLDLFVACFSGVGDRLSQWWRYADQGRGVALGFHVPDLHAAAAKAAAAQWPDFYEVRYIERDDPVFGTLALKIQKLSRLVYGLPDPLSGTKRVFPYGLKQILRKLEPSVKNKALEEENEYRVVFQSPRPSDYKVERANLVPYLNVPIEASITQIRLGPLCKVNEFHFRDFIEERLGYSVDVNRSRATLRA
jgi:hypothetical protein